MKICVISDLHGKLDFAIKPCDILCICGDIVPTYIQVYMRETLDWLARDFVPWCDKQPCEKVFLIAGNHDWTAMRHPDDWENMFKGTKITYLLDSLAEYKGLKIYGTPWCHQFYNWAFMASDEDLKKIYSKMPEGVDILLTHDCPYGNNDILLQEDFYTGDHIGCKPLGEAVDEKKPRYQFCGHLHSCNHDMEKRGETEIRNVSILNEHYDRVYEPCYIEISEQ